MTAPAYTPSPSRTVLYTAATPSPGCRTYSVAEAAQILGVGEQTVRDAIHAERLPVPVVKVLGRYRIPKAALDALVAGL